MSRLLNFFCIFLLPAMGTASAQPWALAQLEKSPRHQEWVTLKNGARNVQCFVVYPEVKDKAPAILLVHEIFGLSDWARETADELAAAGYIVIAPDLVSGLGPGGGGTSQFSGTDPVVRVVSSLPPDQVTGDLNAAADYVLQVPSCNGKLAVAGFCWGGGQAFRFASNRTDLKAAFVFYGPPPGPDALGRIQAPVYGFYGGNDARISSTVPATTDQMKKAGRVYEPVVYEGAGHGFMRTGEDPAGSDPNKKARADAWARLLDLLKKI